MTTHENKNPAVPDHGSHDVPLSHVATREQTTTLRQNLPCIIYSLLVSLASFQYGLDLSSINGAQAIKGFLQVFGYPDAKLPIGYGIDPSFQQAITSMMQVGIIIGSLALGPCGKYLGRRYSFVVAVLFAVLGNTILIVSTNKGAIIFGRIAFGFSNAIFTGMSTVYISEAAPPHLRGFLVSFQQVAANLGTIVGACVNNGTATMNSRLSYQIPLIVLYAVPVYFSVLVFFIPESPRWLVLQDRSDQARVALGRLRGTRYPQQLIDAELLSIQDAVLAEREHSIGKAMSIRIMFSEAERRRTLLTIACTTFHAASGFTFLAGYATYFFQISGSTNAFIDSVITNCVSTAGALAGLALNRYIGRRPMLLTGFAIQAIIMFVIAAVWAAKPYTLPAEKLVVAMVVIFQTVFSAACGPTSLISAGELPSSQLRAATYGVGNGVGFFGGFVTALTTPYFINPAKLNFGPKSELLRHVFYQSMGRLC